MTDPRHDARYSFEIVSARIGEAGMTLLAMHVPGTRPAGYRCFWPEIPGAINDDRRPSPPPPAQITRMDEALGWISLIPEAQIKLRRLVGARALTSPRSGEPVFSWKQLGAAMGCSDKTAKTWWIGAIEMIVLRLNRPGLCADPRFRGTRHAAAGALRHAGERLGQAVRRVELA